MNIRLFDLNRSIKISENFFNALEDKLKDVSLDGYYDTFNNCREQGYVLQLYDRSDNTLNIWASESRNSDNIMIVTGTNKDIDINKMFSENAYKNAKYFKCDDYGSAVDYAIKKMRVSFPMDIYNKASYKFDTNKGIDDIRRILLDAKDLDYEDYHDLATFEDVNNKYSCDLIIDEGKVCLRYSKINDDDSFDNLTIEKFDPDLTNEVTLMVGMQDRLDKFIRDELEYELEMDRNISI